MQPDLSQFKQADSVTPTKWKGPDGRVWERTGEKREPLEGEYIWFETSAQQPYEYKLDERTVSALVTPIWKLSEDQNWEPEPPKLVTPPTIEELISRAQFTEDALELNRLLVLGMLYQARVLVKIMERLENVAYAADEVRDLLVRLR